MQDDSNRLSRRRLLGGAATIGGAAALGGTGTMAFFSDEETFANNQLTAGELDMKVGWSEHYSDWSPDEGEGVEVRMWDGPAGTTGGPGDLMQGETGLPTNDSWLIAVDDPVQFLANTQTEAEELPANPCDGLDVPDDQEQPVIDISDVKPGDFGEVTFDFALCDNPGFVWMNGELLDASENGVNEPESKDPDEQQGVVELLDEVQAAVWSDDGGGQGGGSGSGSSSSSSGPSTAATLSATNIANSGDTASDLADSLIAGQSSITISNPSYTGADVSAGTFSGGIDAVGIDDGVILSSGNVEDVEGPNDAVDTTTNTGTPGDSDLDTLTSGDTFNAASLEFEFEVPQGEDQVFFNYVFGSEEYDEYVDTEFNDVFGFFLNGTNIATIDNPDNPGEDTVAINNINNGENSNLYIDNRADDGGTDAGRDTEMDGLTVVLDVGADVNPGSTNTLKLAIADTADSILDSWVLIEGESISTDPDPQPTGTEGDNIKQSGEEYIAQGSLREVLNDLESDAGLPLEGDIPAEDGGGMGRNCFSAVDSNEMNDETHSIGFAWWLPVDHGNEVQSDSVAFDIGFYTEQCRHNDGENMPTTASVNFEDQESDGSSVVVDSATLPSGGYVVIHASDNGSPGAVLGHSSYLSDVTNTDVTVSLDSPISSSQELIAMAHKDDGDQQYEFPNADGPYTDNGAVIDPAQITIVD
ncbi:MAG: choice-of-anchor L domain-containing protein [Halolamina sp.]